MNDLFKDVEIINAYTRVQAIKDGVLIDIMEFARKAGFRVPVAVTSGVFSNPGSVGAFEE